LVEHDGVAKKLGADRARSNSTLPEALGAELTERRVKVGWSQLAIAERLGFDVNYIGQLERAENSPTLCTLISISTVFGTRVSELLRAAEARLSNKG
jgi:transcriptional regulator with XRE-family HTH domain